MIYVMEMSTDADIIATPLDAGWGHAIIGGRYRK